MRKRKWLFLFLAFAIVCSAAAVFFLEQGKTEALLQTEPKIIGIKDYRIKKGEALPEFRKGLKKTETVDGEITVDVRSLNRQAPGEYHIYYKYKDIWGKKHSQTAKCTVYEDPIEAQQIDKESKSQNDFPPKTGDERKVVWYAITLGISGGILLVNKLKKSGKRKI